MSASVTLSSRAAKRCQFSERAGKRLPLRGRNLGEGIAGFTYALEQRCHREVRGLDGVDLTPFEGRRYGCPGLGAYGVGGGDVGTLTVHVDVQEHLARAAGNPPLQGRRVP